MLHPFTTCGILGIVNETALLAWLLCMFQALQGDVTVVFPLSLPVPIFARDVGGVLEDRVRVPAFGITLIPYNM